jgi:hypothetical protein
MYEIRDDKTRKTVYLKLNGLIREQEMKKFCDEFKAVTDTYQGKQHYYLADMRGLKVMEPSVASILGEAIGYTRKRGVMLCAHLSDSTIAKLQAMRLAREVQTNDSATVDVVSMDEAEKVLVEARSKV